MKKITTILLIMFGITFPLMAQKPAIPKECKNEFFTNTVDSLTNVYAEKGYALVKQDYFPMESNYEAPLVVPLTIDKSYAFCFIGEPDSKLYEVRVYDWSEKQVFYKKLLWGDVDGYIISFPIVARSQYYMIKPVQIHKTKKQLCGVLLLFKDSGKQISN